MLRTPTLQDAAARSADDATEFINAILADSESDAVKNGAVACIPKYDSSGHVLYEGVKGTAPVVLSPVLPHRLWLTVDPEPSLRVVLSVPLDEFDDKDNLTGGKTCAAKHVEAFVAMFGPSGLVNKTLAQNLSLMLQSTKKKVPIIAKIEKLPIDKRVVAFADDAKLGFVSGAGTKSTFMPKQMTKIWHRSGKGDDSDADEITQSYAQLTLEIKKLFVQAGNAKTPEQQTSDLAMFETGSDLWQWQNSNPDFAPNLQAIKVTCADPDTEQETWVDLVRSMTNTTFSKTAWIQTHSCPWKTWILADRKRIVHSSFVNAIDVYTVVRYDATGSTRTLLNAKQRARADNEERKRSGSLLANAAKAPKIDSESSDSENEQ
tara:strand:- start:187 stop:1314 length:1128 start_codon:yes stop_codon:yes gene_type:complete